MIFEYISIWDCPNTIPEDHPELWPDPNQCRTFFMGHDFAMLNGKVYDSCLGQVDLGVEGWEDTNDTDPDRPDYGIINDPSTFVPYDLDGRDDFDSYRDKVVDSETCFSGGITYFEGGNNILLE